MDRMLLLSAVVAMAGAALPASAAEDVSAIAPTGKLRVAIAISPAPGAFWAGRDPKTGEPKGVTIDLGRAMAAQLKIPLELVIFDNSGAVTDAGAKGAWDITFVPMDDDRAKKIDFGAVYNIGQSSFLARGGSGIQTLADVDKPGVRVLGISETTTIRAATAWAKNTKPVGVATVENVLEQMKNGQADAFAMGREALVELSHTLPGSSVTPGYFFQTKTATAAPKGRPAALAFASAFVENAKKSGMMRKVFDANGLRDQAVAP